MFCHVALSLCPKVRTKPFGFLTWDNVKWLELSMDKTNKTEIRRDKHSIKIYTWLCKLKMKPGTMDSGDVADFAKEEYKS